MKNFLITIILFYCGMNVSAQDIEGGTIKYQRIANLGITPEGEWAEFKKTLPKSRTTNFILFFSKDESLFAKNSKENEAPDVKMQKAMYFANAQGKPRPEFSKMHIDLEKRMLIKQTEFMTRLFREEVSLPKLKWKMGAATKKILGYNCMSAEIEMEGKKILTWFSPDVPIPVGPDQFYGLPGVILEANINQGQVVWLASYIDLSKPAKELLSKPKEGKKVNMDEYNKIQEEKIKEWEKQRSSKKVVKGIRLDK